jgi:hypothetical protein
MTKTLQTKLKIESWDERPSQEFDDGRKVSTADIALGEKTDALSGTMQSVLFYRADGTSSFVALMHLTGTLDGRSGSFALQGQGTYDGTTAHSESTVVPDSGTDELAGLRGTAESASTHDDYPFMPLTLTYHFE